MSAVLSVPNKAGSEVNFDVNCGRVGSLTPLMASINLCQVDLVTLLMQKGADVNARGPAQKTCLHYAASKEHMEILRKILIPECEVNAQDEFGQTALHISCCTGNSELAEILLTRRAEPDTPDSHGMTPLHCAASSDIQQSSRVIRVLLNKRLVINIDARSQENYTPLMLAVRSSAVEKADILLKEGSDCHTFADHHHHLPLHTAKMFTEISTLRTVRDKFAEILVLHQNLTNTPLQLACHFRKLPNIFNSCKVQQFQQIRLAQFTRMVKLLMNQSCAAETASLFVNVSGSQNIADALCIACTQKPQLLVLPKQPIPCGSNYRMSMSSFNTVAVHLPELESSWSEPFPNLFRAPQIQLATYELDTPLAILLANHTRWGDKFMELLKMLLGAGAEVNPKACNASAPLVYYLGLPASRRLEDQQHLMMLEILMSYGLDPDYRIRSDECDFDGPDTLAAACLNDPRTLAYFFHRSRTTPRQLLSHWTKLFELAASRHMEVIEPFRDAISLRMSTSLKVILAYGQHAVARDNLVGRFIAAARDITLSLEVNQDELREMKNKVPSLAHLTRASLREFMSHNLQPGVMVKEVIYSLDLPYILNDFLFYDDVDFKQFPSSYEVR